MLITLEYLVELDEAGLTDLRHRTGGPCLVYDDDVLVGYVDLETGLFYNLEGQPVLKLRLPPEGPT